MFSYSLYRLLTHRGECPPPQPRSWIARASRALDMASSWSMALLKPPFLTLKTAHALLYPLIIYCVDHYSFSELLHPGIIRMKIGFMFVALGISDVGFVSMCQWSGELIRNWHDSLLLVDNKQCQLSVHFPFFDYSPQHNQSQQPKSLEPQLRSLYQ